MKKLNLTLYLAIRDIPVDDLSILLEYLSDASGAVILMNIQFKASFDLISKLPRKKRDRIIQCLIDLEGAEERLLQQALAKVEKEILKVITSQYDKINVKERLAELICEFDSSQRVSALDVIKTRKTAYYNKINRKILDHKKKNGIYFFEDILSFDDAELRDRIQEVDTRIIAIAIKEAGEAIKDKIMENMPRRVQEMVMDDLKMIESVTTEQVDEAENAIVLALMKKKK